VNSRWIAHHGLQQSAADYLEDLEATDPDRLAASCERAKHLVSLSKPGEDPKPWFYAGLFSLATAPEAKRFLADHWFTAECIPSVSATIPKERTPGQISPGTHEKMARIREVLQRLE
jgi:hypothetical protein